MAILLKAVYRWATGAMRFCLCVPMGQAITGTAATVNHLFAPWDRADSPGAAVVILKDGAVVYERGYGCANLEDRTPITPQTVFDVASVAKQFTGLATAMLIEQR